MSLETKSKIIDGSKYEVTQFPAREAIRLKIRIAKIIGPSWSTVLGGLIPNAEKRKSKGNQNAFSSIMDGDLNMPVVGSAIEKLFYNLNENESLDLIERLFSLTRKDGVELKPEIIDIMFAGKTLTIYKVIWFVIQTNYPDFFGARGIGSLLDTSERPVSLTGKEKSSRD